MRLHAQTALIESGFVRIPEAAPWLAEYLHELTVFPRGKHDDQADSTAQFLDWYKKPGKDQGYIDWLREAAERVRTQNKPEPQDQLGGWLDAMAGGTKKKERGRSRACCGRG